MIKFLIFLSVLVQAQLVFAQSTLPELPSKQTQLGILNALNENKPNLGMHILSIENGYHVMMSNNGRYMVKGSLWDLWDGVFESQVVPGVMKELPASISPQQFFINFGKKDGLPLYSYVKYGCHSCREVVETLFSQEITSKYNVHLMVLHNDPLSKLVSQHIYCSKADMVTQLRSLFLESSDFDPSNLNECKASVASSTPTAAGAQGVKALPFTYFPEREYGVIGEVSGYL